MGSADEGFTVEAGFTGEFAVAVGLLKDDLAVVADERLLRRGVSFAAMASVMRVEMGVKSEVRGGKGSSGCGRTLSMWGPSTARHRSACCSTQDDGKYKDDSGDGLLGVV